MSECLMNRKIGLHRASIAGVGDGLGIYRHTCQSKRRTRSALAAASVKGRRWLGDIKRSHCVPLFLRSTNELYTILQL